MNTISDLGTCSTALILLLAAAMVEGDEKKGPAQKQMVVHEKSNGTTVKIAVGQEFQLRLTGEKAMTGWGGLILAPAKDVLSLSKRTFEPAPKAADSAIGTYVYYLKALKAGMCDVHCRYIYPDGNGYEKTPRLATQVVREFRFKIEVIDPTP